MSGHEALARAYADRMRAGSRTERTDVRHLETRLQAATWLPARHIARPFVRYLHPSPSPGVIWREESECGPPQVSVVIPTGDADRGGYFRRLLGQIDRQAMPSYELIVVRGDPRQGRAINVAAALARGRYLLTLDDDTALPDADTFGRLLAVLENHAAIGMAGGNNVIPRDASAFVQRVMRQVPRRSWTPVEAITDSDLAEHPCLMMRTAEFKAVGGENEWIPRGLDPYLRQAFRDAGLRVVVVPDVVYHHLPPDSGRKLLKQYFRNGSQAAFVNRHFPQWVIETPSDHGAFALQVPFRRRLVRYLQSLWASLRAGQWIWLGCQVWYAVGFAWGWVTERRREALR